MLCQIVLFDGLDPLDVIAPYEVLSAGSMAARGQPSVELVSAEGPREMPSGAGLDLLDATGVLAVDARVVDDGDLVSSAGVTSGLDLAPYLPEPEVEPRITPAVEQLFAHERRAGCGLPPNRYPPHSDAPPVRSARSTAALA
ncbi:hypothetical protein AB0I68_37325 [Streptomyces sp. NPDC050448]|uniref:hypothetical protein n=1 Tax=Streptomyces sp. NPDC050448 TaxID=3155404 RepID=UPI0034467AE3